MTSFGVAWWLYCKPDKEKSHFSTSVGSSPKWPVYILSKRIALKVSILSWQWLQLRLSHSQPRMHTFSAIIPHIRVFLCAHLFSLFLLLHDLVILLVCQDVHEMSEPVASTTQMQLIYNWQGWQSGSWSPHRGTCHSTLLVQIVQCCYM